MDDQLKRDRMSPLWDAILKAIDEAEREGMSSIAQDLRRVLADIEEPVRKQSRF